MGVVLLKCHKCGRNYAIGNMKYEDAHKCKCGEILKWDSNYIGSCDCAPLYPNMPAEKQKQIPGFGNGSSVCKDNESKISKGLTKKITIDVEAGKGFDKLLEVVKELKESIEDIPGLVMIDNEGKVSAVPVISVDSQMILFKTTGHYHKDCRKKLAEEYTNKLGIRCEVIDNATELVAVIDG